MLLFRKSPLDNFPPTMSIAQIMWCYKCWNNNALYLKSFCLWGAQTILQFYRHDLIRAVSGLLFNYRTVHCSKLCKLFLLDVLLELPILLLQVQSIINYHQMTPELLAMGRNGNFLNLKFMESSDIRKSAFVYSF